jgi:hypothetical protein
LLPTVCGLAKAGNKNSDLQFIPDFQSIPNVEQIPNAPAFAKPWLGAGLCSTKINVSVEKYVIFGVNFRFFTWLNFQSSERPISYVQVFSVNFCSKPSNFPLQFAHFYSQRKTCIFGF